MDGKLAETGIKGGQAKYILAVCNNAGISQDALAAKLYVNKSNASRQLAALEEGGYIYRKEDENDRRVSLVYPAERGYEVLPLIRAANDEWRAVLTEGFTEEQKQTLSTLTERLCENAEKVMAGGK